LPSLSRRTAINRAIGAVAVSLLPLALCPLPAVSAGPILDGSRIVEHTFDNGFRLIMKPEHQWNLVSVGLYVRAGSFCETDENAGVAHLLEHLLFEATVRGDEQTVGPAIEALGGYVNAATTRDFTHIDVTVASQYLGQVAEMLAAAVFEPELTVAAVTRERNVVMRELMDRLANAEGMLAHAIWSNAFKQHPYGRGVGGTPEQAADLTLEELQDFHETFYVPGNMALIVVGDLDPEALTQQVGELFGQRPRAPLDFTDPPPEARLTSSRKVVETRESDTTIVTFAWHAPGIGEPADVWAMDLIYTILGEGKSGRLYQALEDKGLALMSTVDFLTQRYPGLFVITALTKPDSEREVRSTILAEIQRLGDEQVAEEELAEAKRLLRAAYAFSNEAYSDQVGSLGFYEAIATHQVAIDYIGEVNQVTPADLQRVARKYLVPDLYTLIIVRPEAQPGDTREANGGRWATCPSKPRRGEVGWASPLAEATGDEMGNRQWGTTTTATAAEMAGNRE